MNKIFVGILVMTRVKPSENEPEELVALLQRRGKINSDNDYGFKNQSFAGLCEITSYGKGKPGEPAEQALRREMTEELGEQATKIILSAKPIELYKKTESDNDQIFVWSCLVDKEILKEIKLDISTGGIEILREKDLPSTKFATFAEKGLSVKNTDDIDIFEVPREAIKKAFTLFK